LNQSEDERTATMGIHAAIETAVDGRRSELTSLSHRIHAHPEVAWEEVQAARWLGEALTGLGYTVEAGFCGMPTAFRARIGHGPLRIAICAEYDALPGLGHACGHNVIAGAAVGAAAGLAALVDDLGLTVEVLGTPAEEGGGGKITMLEGGGFDGLHAAMMIHPGPGDVAHARPFAASHVEVSYEGKAAHAAAYPEQGRNAADALTVAQVAVGLLRQQTPSSTRVHGIVTNGGEASNAIPQHASGRWFIRAETLAELAEFEPRVRNCFEAGALATGTALQIDPLMRPYAHFDNDEELLGHFVRNATRAGRHFLDERDPRARMNRSSTDMGNVSLQLPAIHPFLGINSYPAINHQKEFAAHCITPDADRALRDGAVAMAQTIADVARDPALRDRLMAVEPQPAG
jgi:amidohydrolase